MSGFDGGESSNLEAYVAAQTSFADHLGGQLALAVSDPIDRMIGLAMIDSIDETGYVRESAEDISPGIGRRRPGSND